MRSQRSVNRKFNTRNAVAMRSFILHGKMCCRLEDRIVRDLFLAFSPQSVFIKCLYFIDMVGIFNN